MINKLFFFTSLFLSTICFTQSELFEQNQTHTYEEAIKVYQDLAEKHPNYSKFENHGNSDYGLPVSLFMINKSGQFYPREYAEKNVLLINNAIHPGEPCGVDACIKLSKELLANPDLIPENLIIAIIPIYNVGGAHNRSCCSRTNQNGPEEYGFRGNSKNLDLNRDFIKADSKNTLAFYEIFHMLNPNVFVDTHTSNGADYQHTMTLITSQINKMHPFIGEFTRDFLNPALFQEMEKVNYPMVPYVHTIDQIPDNGIQDYLETPRYSTGYTNLFNTISYVTEAHMLKPYKERVQSTYEFLKVMINLMEENHEEFKKVKNKADQNLVELNKYPLNWFLDTTHFDTISFNGFEASYKTSDVTGLDRLFYDQSKPFTKWIKYYNKFTPSDFVLKPNYYIIPQAWTDVIDNLKANNIKVYQLSEAKSMEVEVYYIINFETVSSPYEGHYLHHSMQVRKDTLLVDYRKGDYVISTNNSKSRYIIETLEPKAADSYLAWNYFDAILQQKEWFSPYVFEDEAAEILKSNPDLKAKLEQRKVDDASFANSSWAQLYFIYQTTSHYEPTHNQYPITRYMGDLTSEELEESILLRN